MGCCNSVNLIAEVAEDHIHTDKTTCNIKEPQRKYRLGTFSNRYIGWVEGA